MRISELAERAGLSVATVKFYLRAGLMPPGRPRSATQADYDQAHLSRLRLVRALAETGGLSLASVRDVLAAIEAGPQDVASAVGAAHEALGAASGDSVSGEPVRALAALDQLGWTVWPGSRAVRQLDAALAAAASVGVPADPDRIRAYGRAAMLVARSDVASMPADSAEGTAAYVVLGTVLYEPILLALRRMAQQQAYTEGSAGATDASPGTPFT